jgi:hypothetical protein
MNENKPEYFQNSPTNPDGMEQEMQLDSSPSGITKDKQIHESELQQIRQALQGLKFGQVTIVMHDGAMVQIERTEKRRIRPSKSSNGR